MAVSSALRIPESAARAVPGPVAGNGCGRVRGIKAGPVGCYLPLSSLSSIPSSGFSPPSPPRLIASLLL